VSYREIKRYVRSYYQLSYLNKIWIDLERMTFKMRIGDCETEVELPNEIKRELKIEKILNGKKSNPFR
jgi:hypothetical protein